MYYCQRTLYRQGKLRLKEAKDELGITGLDMTESKFEHNSYNFNTMLLPPQDVVFIYRSSTQNTKRKQRNCHLCYPQLLTLFMVSHISTGILMQSSINKHSITERKEKVSDANHKLQNLALTAPPHLCLSLLITLLQSHWPSATATQQALSCLKTFALAVPPPKGFLLQIFTWHSLSWDFCSSVLCMWVLLSTIFWSSVSDPTSHYSWHWHPEFFSLVFITCLLSVFLYAHRDISCMRKGTVLFLGGS